MANPLHTFFGGRRLVRGARCVEPQRPSPLPEACSEAYRLGQLRCMEDLTLYADRPRRAASARQACAELTHPAAPANFNFGVEREYADLQELVGQQGGNMREVMRRAHWDRMQQGGKA